jgi:two-component system, LuxR family, response regulator FixJ
MPEPVVHVIDDDDDARDSLAFLLSTEDLAVETYATAEAFLAVARNVAGVVITDVRMPEIDGLELIRRLDALGVALPIIVITGHADVPLAVEAMKAGVLDFIEKPYDDEIMLGAVRAALARLGETQAREGERAEFRRRIESLTQRERQVMDGLVLGKANKVIAYDLAISQRTVEIYRAHVMTKTQSRSLSELVRMAMLAGFA